MQTLVRSIQERSASVILNLPRKVGIPLFESRERNGCVRTTQCEHTLRPRAENSRQGDFAASERMQIVEQLAVVNDSPFRSSLTTYVLHDFLCDLTHVDSTGYFFVLSLGRRAHSRCYVFYLGLWSYLYT